MSSGFVSGGTIDAPIERSDEWIAAQTELEANRARKAAEAARSDGRSLYETLEANKAAKQEAFEEASRLKNQFRSLDEDEIEFLDSVLESTRAEEERVKRETAEGLELFRRQQEEADKKAREGDALPEEEAKIEEEWVAGGRKRKRKGEKEGLKGVKLRRASSVKEEGKGSSSPRPRVKKEEGEVEVKAFTSLPKEESYVKKEEAEVNVKVEASASSPKEESKISKPITKRLLKPTAAPAKLGLVDYGSEEDDDW